MIDFLHSGYIRLAEYMGAGGVVMLPLVVVSLVMWALIADRTLFFRRMHGKNLDVTAVLEHIRKDRQIDPGHSQGAAFLLVSQFLSRRSGDRGLDRHILDEAIIQVSRSLNDHLALIGVLAAIAPFLGLLGTVTGMMVTFDVLAVFGTGNAQAMAIGISEALITTQTGLLVAIPGLFMKGFLDRRARTVQQRVAAVGFYLRRQL